MKYSEKQNINLSSRLSEEKQKDCFGALRKSEIAKIFFRAMCSKADNRSKFIT